MMATRLLCLKRTVLYGRNLQTLARALCQHFSSERKGPRSPHALVVFDEAEGSGKRIWPDLTSGLLGPKDSRLPLPGDVGFSYQLQPPVAPAVIPSPLPAPDVLITSTNYERQFSILHQFHTGLAEEEAMEEMEEQAIEELLLDLPKPSDILEVAAQDCPKLVRKDFSDLFPGRDVTTGSLTVISLTQKTVTDMSMFSDEMELEREELTGHFVDAAKAFCLQIAEAGFWADFIDPTSGRPYLGPFTSATLFETDERYRHLGFVVEDLGCCKVISHSRWGTRSFVGCLFTNLPVDSPLLKEILQKHQSLSN